MDNLLIELTGLVLRKAYFLLRYRNSTLRAEKEAAFLSKDEPPRIFKIPAVLLLILIGGMLLVASGRAIYDLVHGNPAY